jgi:UDP-glucuronate 4-epimerase
MLHLVTGCAGFIGSNVAAKALELGHEVIGIDNLNNHYDPELKNIRVRYLQKNLNFKFIEGDINDTELLDRIGNEANVSSLYHLAAQAGVRISAEDYSKYIEANVCGFTKILNFAVTRKIPNFIYASSSSVYGNTEDLEFNEISTETNPTSYYGSTKLFNEKIASVMVRGSSTRARGLRFFTVYGEMGRPDMAYFRIVNSILNKKKFNLFGDGNIRRDFTYISDVTNATLELGKELSSRGQGYSDIVNIGGGKPYSMNELISEISRQLGQNPDIIETVANANDVAMTKADTSKLNELIGFTPRVSVQEGISRFIEWATKDEVQIKLDGWVNSAP